LYRGRPRLLPRSTRRAAPVDSATSTSGGPRSQRTRKPHDCRNGEGTSSATMSAPPGRHSRSGTPRPASPPAPSPRPTRDRQPPRVAVGRSRRGGTQSMLLGVPPSAAPHHPVRNRPPISHPAFSRNSTAETDGGRRHGTAPLSAAIPTTCEEHRHGPAPVRRFLVNAATRLPHVRATQRPTGQRPVKRREVTRWASPALDIPGPGHSWFHRIFRLPRPDLVSRKIGGEGPPGVAERCPGLAPPVTRLTWSAGSAQPYGVSLTT
jgi:hypothetical protein